MANYQGYNPVYQSPFNQPMGFISQQYNQPIQTQSMSVPFNDVKFANETEALSYMPNPNQRVLFFDSDNNMFRIKSTDSFGKTTLETYKFEKINNNSSESKNVEIDTKNFAKITDLKELAREEDLKKSVANLESNITKKIEEIKLQYDKKIEDLKKSIVSKLLSEVNDK